MMTYWDIQTKLILELNELGFPFKLRDRLDIFALYLKLEKIAKKKPKLQPKILELLDLLEWQVELRKAGLEPRLDESRKRYVAE
jgi:hypothetical protein